MPGHKVAHPLGAFAQPAAGWDILREFAQGSIYIVMIESLLGRLNKEFRMTSPVTEEMVLSGRLPRMILAAETESALPLEQTSVTVQVNAAVASVLVAQRFGNPLNEAAELEYIYPLPHDAAVTDFVLRIGARTIRGDIQELKQAREAYENARESGQRAGLLEQRRPNLFGLRLANIQPGEIIQAEVRYQQRLTFNEDGYEFVFPMGITPKYDSPTNPGEGEGTQAPIARQGEKVGPLKLSIAVDAGLACGDPVSPSHPLEVSRLDERRFQVRLAGEQIPDHDFVLRFAVCGDLPRAAAWSSPSADGAYFLASILPPRPESEPLPGRREFIFVLDRSGSMSGEPIVQARNALRACLRALNLEDTFRILLFDDQMEWYQAEWSHVSQASIDQADAYLAGVDARGGTEIVTALESALNLPADAARTRFVVFLTDGAVSAEARTLESLRRKLGSARVFTFGIGPSVNRALLAQMARFGRGEAEFLQSDEDIEGAIIRFQDRVSFPALTDITLRWKGAKAWDLYPARLPDLYIGQPLLICGRYKASGKSDPVLLVSGRRGEEAFEAEVTLQAGQAADTALARVWARARVDELLDQAVFEPDKADTIRSAVIGLSLEHRLVTPFSAFVAVDEQPGQKKARKPRLIRVSQPLPAGLEMDAFQQPQALRSGGSAGAMMPMMAPPPPASPAMFKRLQQPSPKQSMNFSAMISETSADMPFFDTVPEEEVMEIAPPPATREEALRRLARTQQLDGSWGGDVERSAAVLLAFVRAGHTTRAGSFRQTLRRAVEWLAAHQGSGLAGFACARALRELADATAETRHSALAAAAQAALSAASNPLETAFSAPGRPTAPQPISDLDSLRLAGLAGGKAVVPSELLKDELAQAWAALLF
jgi:Ca-activated chloride channel family protein